MIRHWMTLCESPLDDPSFQSWFGHSKVTDSHGDPLVVYHGSFDSFHHFSLDQTGNTDAGYLGKGFYFGSVATANVYAGKYSDKEGGNVRPVYLSLQNPLMLSARFDGRREIDREKRVREALELPSAATAEHVTQAAKAAGYDGVIYNLKGDKEFVAFDQHQIRTAIGHGSGRE